MSKRWREVPLKTGEETEVHVGTHGWLAKGAWATLHAGVPTRVAGWAGLRRFCRCPAPVPVCLLRSPCVMPDVTVLPCRNWMVFHRRPAGVSWWATRHVAPSVMPICPPVRAHSAAGSTSSLFLRPNQLHDHEVGWFYEEGKLDEFLSLVVHG